jgi:ParB-like chromosome segregation protein Spo0J
MSGGPQPAARIPLADQSNETRNTRRATFMTNNNLSVSAQAAPSWRGVLPIHPAANLFPLLSKDDLEELSRDIKENGLCQPCHIIAGEDGRPVLLDGRNRLDALEHIGGEITLDNRLIFEQLPADVDPYAFVISANIHRRHLTGEKKRELIGKLLKATPEKSNRQIADTVKASPTTVGTVRAEMEATGDVSKLDTRRDSQGRQQPESRAPKRAPARGDIEQIRAKKAAVPKPLPAETAREAVAPDEELALLREFARFVIGCASVSTNFKDRIEWKMLLDRVTQVLGGAPLRPKADAPAASATAPPRDGLDIPEFLLRGRAP